MVLRETGDSLQKGALHRDVVLIMRAGQNVSPGVAALKRKVLLHQCPGLSPAMCSPRPHQRDRANQVEWLPGKEAFHARKSERRRGPQKKVHVKYARCRQGGLKARSKLSPSSNDWLQRFPAPGKHNWLVTSNFHFRPKPSRSGA